MTPAPSVDLVIDGPVSASTSLLLPQLAELSLLLAAPNSALPDFRLTSSLVRSSGRGDGVDPRAAMTKWP